MNDPMSVPVTRGQSSGKSAGRLTGAIMRLLTKRATIVAVEALGGRFYLITLEGPQLVGAAWNPGDKIQIAMGSVFTARTYTPIEWDVAAGRTCILAYAHGDGPGSAWVRGVRIGDEFDMFGPRPSLHAPLGVGPLVFFGDETSIGMACALIGEDRSRSVSCRIEVDDPQTAGRIAERLGSGADIHLFKRRANGDHVADMEADLPFLASGDTGFVLTGKAGTIQQLRQSLKRHGVPASRIATKAYWAPGKKGLD